MSTTFGLLVAMILFPFIFEFFFTGIPRRNNYTHIFIQTGDNVGWDLLKFCVVFTISDNFLAINFTNPNIRHGFSCLS